MWVARVRPQQGLAKPSMPPVEGESPRSDAAILSLAAKSEELSAAEIGEDWVGQGELECGL